MSSEKCTPNLLTNLQTGDQEATLEEAEEKEKEKCIGEKTRDNSGCE